MKKIFTLLSAAIAAFGVQASAFELYFGDTPVEDGQTYETQYSVEKLEQGNFSMYIVNQPSNLFLHGTPGEQATVTVELLSGNNVSVCSLDGVCINLPTAQGAASITKTGALKQAVEDAEIHTESQFFSEDFSSLKDVKIKVTASSGSYNATIYVNMTAQMASVKSVVSNDYVKAAGGNILNYSVSAPATLQLYSITGSQAAKYPISGNGALNLSSLPKGVYIYTTGTHSGKLVIR